MIKKWLEIITDHRIGLRERMFHIVMGTCIIAIICTMPMGRSIWNILLLGVNLAAIAMIANVSIRRKRIQAGATAIVVLLLITFPILIFEQAQKRSILVTTDSVCDLPEELRKAFAISVCPYYVCTDKGRFLDGRELCPEELLMHISRGRTGYSLPPDVEDYERFFAEKMTEAQNIIHITMAKHVSGGYQNALEAAKSFENVTVVDSGHLSSSLGLTVLCAAYMAE